MTHFEFVQIFPLQSIKHEDILKLLSNRLQMSINSAIFRAQFGELLSGFLMGNKEAQNRAESEEFMALVNVVLVDIGQSTSENFAQIFKVLRSKGRPLPTNDIWIASTAIEYNLAIFTYDAHFQRINNLFVVSDVSEL